MNNKRIQHPGGKSISILAAGLLIAVGPWMAAFDSWTQTVAVSNVGVLLGIIGGVFLAWSGKSPIADK